MRPTFMILSLFTIALGISWLSATPAQRDTVTSKLWGPLPARPLPQVATDRPTSPPRNTAPPSRVHASAPATRTATARAKPQREAKPRRFAESADNACSKPPTLSVDQVQSSSVYQFVNTDGVVSFSDKRPTQATTRDVSGKYRRREQYFRVNLIHDQAPNATRMQTRIMADTQQIFMFLARHLEVDQLRQVFLDLRLLPTAASFDAYRKKVAPKLDTNSGFYSSARNEAVVRMRSGRRGDDKTLKVVRHETSHLIAAALFGNLPKWLNEGLAEYFERLDVDGQAKIIRPSSYYLRTLRKQMANGSLPNLQQHLRLSRRQWLQEDQNLAYGIGWSLIYYLMTEPRGRHLLAQLLDAQAAHRCQRFDTADYIDDHFPGGIADLDRRWRDWLSRSDPPAHYF